LALMGVGTAAASHGVGRQSIQCLFSEVPEISFGSPGASFQPLNAVAGGNRSNEAHNL
jgi:hypothetical protein